jgi:hypothetical protein
MDMFAFVLNGTETGAVFRRENQCYMVQTDAK